jgi:hypothetical protein
VSDEIRQFLEGQGIPGEPAREVAYPPLEQMEMGSFLKVLGERAESFLQTAVATRSHTLEPPPIPIPEMGASGIVPLDPGDVKVRSDDEED